MHTSIIGSLSDDLLSALPTIPVSQEEILTSTASKGDQSKWKAGSKWIKADTQGFEGLSEELSSIFLSCIAPLDYVAYHSCIIDQGNGNLLRGCFSETMFKNKDEILITFHKLYEQLGFIFEDTLEKKSTEEQIRSTIDFMKYHFDVDITLYLLQTLYVDRLILNEDRHPSNLGLIKNIITKKYRTPPIFDNGLAFLARQNQWGNMPTTIAIRKLKYEPFGNKQTTSLSNMFTFKLIIDVDLLNKKLADYTNPLYENHYVKQSKQLLLQQLSLLKGKLWK